MSEATAAQIERREPLMKIRGLTKEFKIKSRKLGAKPQILHALSDVSLDVYEGETLGIIGESGCGKSTLGRTIIQLHKATAGTVEYQGRNIFELKGAELKALKKDIQMVFQDPYSSLDPRNTCEDIIAEPLKVHNIITDPKARQERVLELMREVGLDIQHMNRYPHEFSGGQRQRINVARALALKPKIIVCDEPVSALDVSIQAQILNLLRDLQKELGLTCIFIGHGLGAVNYVSDRIAVMYLGKMVEIADRKELFDHPLHPYSRALFEAVPIADPRKRRKRSEGIVGGETASNVNTPSGCPFHPRCPHCKGECMSGEMELRPAVPGSSHLTACIRFKELEKEDGKV